MLTKNNSALLTWLSISTAVGIIACLLPLTQTLGYEFSLLTALLTSLGAGHLAALRPERVRDKLAPFPGVRFPVMKLYLKALLLNSLLLFPPLIIVLLNGLRIPPCNISQGLLFFGLLPVPAILFSTAAGLFAGLLSPGRKSASVLWFTIYLALIAWALHTLYVTPAVFSFGPIHGYFPGVLYDTLISIDFRLITYRVATVFHTGLFLFIAAIFYDPASLRLSIKRLTFSSRVFAAPLLFLAVTLAFHFAEPILGQHSTRTILEEQLPQKYTRGRLNIFFSAQVNKDTASSLADDAQFSLHQVEYFFGVQHSNKPIAIFFFNNAAHKGRLMGASKTNVTKPWRFEVYVVIDDIPHDVLRHELAHAVAGEFGRGPFAIAGALNGWWPNPGLIEGLAVAAQGPTGDLTIHQWAAAMNKLKLLPKLSRLFGMGFLNTASSAAYTTAGSFCLWIHNKYGAGALRRLYGGDDWKAVTGKDISILEKQWIDFLNTVTITQTEISTAKQRFDRPSVIGATCVHEISRLSKEAAQRISSGCIEEALELRKAAIERSGGATQTRLGLFYDLVSLHRKQEAKVLAEELLKSNELGKRRVVSVKENLADMLLANEESSQAGKIYADLKDQVSSDNAKRRLVVKEHLTHMTGTSARFIAKALALNPGEKSINTPLLMLHIARATAAAPNDPILSYMAARQFFVLGDDKTALKELDKAQSNGLSQTADSIQREATMLKGKALFRRGHLSKSAQVFTTLLHAPYTRSGTSARAKDWIERCKFTNSL